MLKKESRESCSMTFLNPLKGENKLIELSIKRIQREILEKANELKLSMQMKEYIKAKITRQR